MNHDTALSIFEHRLEDVANLTTIGRTGGIIYRTINQDTSSAHLRRGRDTLHEAVTILRRDKEIVPEDERVSLSLLHDQ